MNLYEMSTPGGDFTTADPLPQIRGALDYWLEHTTKRRVTVWMSSGAAWRVTRAVPVVYTWEVVEDHLIASADGALVGSIGLGGEFNATTRPYFLRPTSGRLQVCDSPGDGTVAECRVIPTPAYRVVDPS